MNEWNCYKREKRSFGDSFTWEPHAFWCQIHWWGPNGAAIKLRKYINGDIDRIKVKVWMVILIYKLYLCEEILSLLPEHFMEKYTMP